MWNTDDVVDEVVMQTGCSREDAYTAICEEDLTYHQQQDSDNDN